MPVCLLLLLLLFPEFTSIKFSYLPFNRSRSCQVTIISMWLNPMVNYESLFHLSIKAFDPVVHMLFLKHFLHFSSKIPHSEGVVPIACHFSDSLADFLTFQWIAMGKFHNPDPELFSVFSIFAPWNIYSNPEAFKYQLYTDGVQMDISSLNYIPDMYTISCFKFMPECLI